MDYEQMSSLEVVCELLKAKHEPTPIIELIQEALRLKGIEDPDGEQTTRLYMDITQSSAFVFCGEGKWDLKANQSLDVFDRDGSFFGTNIPFDEDEEDEEVDVSDYNIDEEDEEDEDEERDIEDVKLYEEEEEDEDDEKPLLDEDEEDDDNDYDYLDEDDYNDIMDNYEDLYDN